jgi:hypothetical protein
MELANAGWEYTVEMPAYARNYGEVIQICFVSLS